MTKEEAIETVTAVGRHCRGPYRTMAQIHEMPPVQRRPIIEALTLAKAQLELSDAESDDPRFVVKVLLQEGMYEAASTLDDLLLAKCGYNLNELVLDAGFDGEEHAAPCPWCGRLQTWRAPWFPNLAEDT